MKTIHAALSIFSLLFAVSVFGASACGDDDPTPPNNTPDAGMVDADAGTGYVCDPADDTPQGMLLNAPLDPSVQVINKTPVHPGDPGPDGLP